MFDPIKGPTNPMAGPAQGHSTEQGDSWHTAVAKINAAFKRIVHAIETGPSIEGVEMVDAEARKELADMRETIANLQMKLDALTAPKASDAPSPPAPFVLGPQDAAPTATDGPGVVTTASTYIGAGNPAA